MVNVDWTKEELKEVGLLIMQEVMEREGRLSDNEHKLDALDKEGLDKEGLEKGLTILSSALDKLPWDRKEDVRRFVDVHHEEEPETEIEVCFDVAWDYLQDDKE